MKAWHWVALAVVALVVFLIWRAKRANPHLNWGQAARQTLGLASFAAPAKEPGMVIATNQGGA